MHIGCFDGSTTAEAILVLLDRARGSEGRAGEKIRFVELALNSLFGIQVVGIERDQRPVLSPDRSESLQPGDQLLVLGTPERVNEMAVWLST